MIKKILDKTADILITISGSLFVIIFIMVVAEIFSRSVLDYSILWVIDFVTLCVCWMLMFGMAYCVYKSEHIKIDLLKKKLPQRFQKNLELILSMLAAIFFFILIIAGWQIAIIKMDIEFTCLRWPSGYAFMALPVFALFSFIFMLNRIVNMFIQKRNSKLDRPLA